MRPRQKSKHLPRQARRTKAEKAEADRRETAYHEAAHTVAGIWLDLTFECVDIIPNLEDGRSGYVDYPGITVPNHGRVTPHEAVELERRIISCLIGVAAEDRYTGRLRWGHGQYDLESAAQMACTVLRGGTLTEVEHYLRYLWVRANELLNRSGFWLHVEAVAKALLERDYLTFD